MGKGGVSLVKPVGQSNGGGDCMVVGDRVMLEPMV